MVLGLLGAVQAQGAAPQRAPRPISINGQALHPRIESKWLASGREGLPVWFLPRLGVVTRNDLETHEIWLEYNGAKLHYAQGHWAGLANAERLSKPEAYGPGDSLHVSLDTLRLLGVPVQGTPAGLNVKVSAAAQVAAPTKPAVAQPSVPKVPVAAKPPSVPPLSLPAGAGRGRQTTAPARKLLTAAVLTPPNTARPNNPVQPAPSPSPSVPIIGPRITEVRSSLTPVRRIQAQRIVIDLTGPVDYSVQRGAGQVSVFLLGASGESVVQKLDSGAELRIAPGINAAGQAGMNVQLEGAGTVGQIQTLQNPDRLVIDSATSSGDESPPPINEAALPQGVTLRQWGGLSLLSFDPARFVPRVVAAPIGSALSVAELVRRAGGVAGVNGGYFDPPSGLSVDFVTVGGQMLSASLEKRAAVGFDARGAAQFGYPRPRYFVTGDSGAGSPGRVQVNTVSARPQPTMLNVFVGDGHTTIASGTGLTTLLLSKTGEANQMTISRVVVGGVVVPSGVLALTFDPARFGQLPRTVGGKLTLRLDYQLAGWENIQEGLAAGPLLLQGGKVVLDPVREAFNVYTGIWRPTRQVAFAQYQGQPTLAFLDFGTPEGFAAALQRVGVSDAVRLDSGSSATVFVTGGYLGNGGYLNTVWSRPVPNAIVLVPK